MRVLQVDGRETLKTLFFGLEAVRLILRVNSVTVKQILDMIIT